MGKRSLKNSTNLKASASEIRENHEEIFWNGRLIARLSDKCFFWEVFKNITIDNFHQSQYWELNIFFFYIHATCTKWLLMHVVLIKPFLMSLFCEEPFSHEWNNNDVKTNNMSSASKYIPWLMWTHREGTSFIFSWRVSHSCVVEILNMLSVSPCM